MQPATFPDFHDAYTATLAHVTDHTEYTISTRGNESAEVLDVCFRISDPRDRLPYLTARPVNIAFNLAETLWYLGGRRDLEMIGHYAPRMAASSVDGSTLTGTAYGSKLFARADDGRTQWDRAIDLLRSDPDTKRAVLAIFHAGELRDSANPDVSCTIAAQCLLRGGRLHLSCFMRGNDAYRGMVSDVFSFTLLQEFAAAQLGVRLGHYTHHVASMHVNHRDSATVARVLAEVRAPGYRRPAFTPPALTGASFDDVATVLAQEEALRTDTARHTPASVAALGLPPFWQQALLVFEAHRQITRTTGPVDGDVLAALDPGYRWLLTRRWSDRVRRRAA
jgi:thymidylate synthase